MEAAEPVIVYLCINHADWSMLESIDFVSGTCSLHHFFQIDNLSDLDIGQPPVLVKVRMALVDDEGGLAKTTIWAHRVSSYSALYSSHHYFTCWKHVRVHSHK